MVRNKFLALKEKSTNIDFSGVIDSEVNIRSKTTRVLLSSERDLKNRIPYQKKHCKWKFQEKNIPEKNTQILKQY